MPHGKRDPALHLRKKDANLKEASIQPKNHGPFYLAIQSWLSGSHLAPVFKSFGQAFHGQAHHVG